MAQPKKFKIKIPAFAGLSPFEIEVESLDDISTTPPDLKPPDYTSPPWKNSLVLDEQWETLDSTLWKVEHSNYGGVGQKGNRLQYFRPENAVVSPASPGGNGNSLRLISKRESYKGAEFTGGMLGTRDVKKWYPRYGRYEFRARLPHGQGVWPAFWLRHRDGSSVCEPDVMEYFHSQNGPCVSAALHRTDSSGKYSTNVLGGKAFLEPPTNVESKQGWHTFRMDILPWKDSNYGDPSQPSMAVRFFVTVDDRIVMDKIDTSAANWSTRYDREAFDICLQGAQIGGDWAGHPDDPLGWSRWLNRCLSGGGSTSDSCRTSTPEGPIIRAAFPAVVEVDYVKVWRYEGAPS